MNSPYCVMTNSGKLQLTKGAFLTLMKKKNQICKILQKSKKIINTSKHNKKTIKKSYTNYRIKQKGYYSNNQFITMSKINNNVLSSQNFILRSEKQIFKNIMIPNVPIIQMDCDNDCESQWPEIFQCVDHMSMSLSLAIYDHMVNKNIIESNYLIGQLILY